MPPKSKKSAQKEESLDDILAEFGLETNASNAAQKVQAGGLTFVGNRIYNQVLPMLQRPTEVHTIPAQKQERLRCLGDWSPVPNTVQTFPEPRVPIDLVYPDGQYPMGQIFEYPPSKQLPMAEMTEADFQDMRRAAACQRETRKWVQSWLKPGIKLIDMCEKLEAKNMELLRANGLQAGRGFPTGCSINHVAAHYSPNAGDQTVLKEGDVMKIDYGSHVNGRIIDTAFTVAFDPQFDNLLKCTQEATNVGLQIAGVDARFTEIGAAIEETILSFEVEIKGKTYPIKPVANLFGHSIGPYHIHDGSSVPITRNNDPTRMVENQMYAIETFASTGKGHVIEDGDCSHYMLNYQSGKSDADFMQMCKKKEAKPLLKSILENFGSLAFAKRWIDELGHTRYTLALKHLVDQDILNPYPPLVDRVGSYVSQSEHTILIRPGAKEILSRGDDY